MRFAILGTDDDVLRLAAAARLAGHEIVWLGDVRTADADAVSQLAPNLVERASEWELLLDRAIADAVLIGRGTATSELRAEQLKRLATESVPILVVHPAFESVLPYYELDMTRRETSCVVRHFNPFVGHPVVSELAGYVRHGHPTLGPIHQVSCERRAADASRENLLASIARDMELLASIVGHITRVTATGPSPQSTSFVSLQIQLTSAGPASLRWSVGPPAGENDGLTLTLIADRGTIVLFVPKTPQIDGAFAWQLETNTNGQQDSIPLPSRDAALPAIHQFAAAAAETNAERRAELSTWESATRSMEVVDAVELSLEKRRTIEVYQQQLTERLAFRGTMAAMGCGLLLVGFLAIVLVTILGGAEGPERQRLLPSWPFVLLAVLAFFLLLQAVPLLAKKSTKERDGHTAEESMGRDLQ